MAWRRKSTCTHCGGGKKAYKPTYKGDWRKKPGLRRSTAIGSEKALRAALRVLQIGSGGVESAMVSAPVQKMRTGKVKFKSLYKHPFGIRTGDRANLRRKYGYGRR